MDSELIELMIRASIDRIINDVEVGKYTRYLVQQKTGVTVKTLEKLGDGRTTLDKLSVASLFALLDFYQKHYGVPRVPEHEDDSKLVIK